MAARRRSKRKANWPDNLYETGGYFSWRNPVDGKHWGLGRIAFADAARQAREANLHVGGTAAAAPSLVDRLTGVAGRSVDAWCDEFLKLLEKRGYADSTLRQHKHKVELTRKAIGTELVERIDTLRINRLLRTWGDVGKDRMRQAMRSFLIDFFNEAIAEGWITSRVNPVDVTRSESVEVQRERLTWETFVPIYDHALSLPQKWIARSMELALVSAQRREDVAVMQFKRADDAGAFIDGGKLWIDQGKTGNKIILPLSLRLNALELSLEDIVRRCRQDNVLSSFLIHHGKIKYQKASPGATVFIDTISKGFARARELSGLEWEGNPPSFHELRSLSERLYKEQGNVDTQVLLGHKDPRSTAIYHDSRGSEWTELKVVAN